MLNRFPPALPIVNSHRMLTIKPYQSIILTDKIAQQNRRLDLFYLYCDSVLRVASSSLSHLKCVASYRKAVTSFQRKFITEATTTAINPPHQQRLVSLQCPFICLELCSKPMKIIYHAFYVSYRNVSARVKFTVAVQNITQRADLICGSLCGETRCIYSQILGFVGSLKMLGKRSYTANISVMRSENNKKTLNVLCVTLDRQHW